MKSGTSQSTPGMAAREKSPIACAGIGASPNRLGRLRNNGYVDLPASTLPVPHDGDALWEDRPPDPLSHPEVYEGVLWRRSVAFFIDWFLMGLAFAVLVFVATLLSIISLGLLWTPLVAVIGLLPALYVTITVGSRRCATPGMQLLDVEIRNWRGEPAGYAQAFLMAVFFYLSVGITGWLILLLGLFTERNRLLHDLFAGTLAVRASRVVGTGSRPV